ncbi:MAG: hypothetical protein M3R24_18245 [Chloroflexota bacterium]|nr:hypothetical protein [Chloroflexota bacterium]PLS78078.1 MAG: hypothetical protein CYG59_20440 [Chloroflexota bacterium]
MWRDFFGGLWRIFTLAQELKQTRDDITTLQQTVERLSRQVERLISDTDHIQAYEKSEREKLLLEVKNVLLIFERRLPPTSND